MVRSAHFVILTILWLFTQACSAQDDTENRAEATEAGNGAEAVALAVSEPRLTGCARAMRFEVDRRSFVQALGEASPSAERLDVLGNQMEDLFRRVAGEMCESGQIDPTRIAPIRRLLVQYGGGADNTVIYRDPGRNNRDLLVLQYAFAAQSEPGGPALPDPADLRDALLCHFSPSENESTCVDRLP